MFDVGISCPEIVGFRIGRDGMRRQLAGIRQSVPVPVAPTLTSKVLSSIIHIVKYEHSLPLPLVAQPVVHQLEYVGLRVLPRWDLDVVGNVKVVLLESCCVARVNPEHSGV